LRSFAEWSSAHSIADVQRRDALPLRNPVSPAQIVAAG
jgi:hypothetical protein